MTLTPAIKGQLTKVLNSFRLPDGRITDYAENGASVLHTRIRAVFARHMPAEQAKHATRKYLAQNGGRYWHGRMSLSLL